MSTALQIENNVSSQRRSKGPCHCGIFIQIALPRAVYEANIYKISSTGIDKAAFDEMPPCSKHVPCEKAKEGVHSQSSTSNLFSAGPQVTARETDRVRKEAMRTFRSL